MSLITIERYRELCSKKERSELFRAPLLFVLAGLFAAIGYLLLHYDNPFLKPVMWVPFVGLIIGAIWSTLFFWKKLVMAPSRHGELQCKHCRRECRSNAVIATGNCTHCGSPFLERPSLISPSNVSANERSELARSWNSLEELEERSQSAQKQGGRYVTYLILVILLGELVLLGLFQFLDKKNSHFAMMGTAAVCGIPVLLWLVKQLIQSYRGWKDIKPQCPLCAEDLSHLSVTTLKASGHCDHCGSAILERLGLGQNSTNAKLFSVKKFREVTDLSRKKEVTPFVILVGIGFVSLIILGILNRIDEKRFGILMIPGSLAILVLLLIGIYRTEQHDMSPKCPHCSQSLHWRIRSEIIASGNCPGCGGKVIEVTGDMTDEVPTHR